MITWSSDHLITRSHHHKAVWSYDHVVKRAYDRMLMWSYDRMITWAYDHTSYFFTIFCRTARRINPSETKFDAKVDFEVHFSLAPQKLDQIKTWQDWPARAFSIPNFCNFYFFGTEEWNVGNRPKRILTNSILSKSF